MTAGVKQKLCDSGKIPSKQHGPWTVNCCENPVDFIDLYSFCGCSSHQMCLWGRANRRRCKDNTVEVTQTRLLFCVIHWCGNNALCFQSELNEHNNRTKCTGKQRGIMMLYYMKHGVQQKQMRFWQQANSSVNMWICKTLGVEGGSCAKTISSVVRTFSCTETCVCGFFYSMVSRLITRL